MAKLTAVALLTVLALPLSAGTVDDAVALAKAGISEEVVLAWVETQPRVALTATDILRLHEAKAPARVIVALLKNPGKEAARANGAAEAQPPRIVERAPAEAAPAPVEREVIRYVERPTITYVTPATTYAAPSVYYVDASPYSYPSYYAYGYSGYPYYGGLSVGLSFGNYSRPYRSGCSSYYGGGNHTRYGGYSASHAGFGISHTGYSSYRPGRTGFGSGGGGRFSPGRIGGSTGGHSGRRF